MNCTQNDDVTKKNVTKDQARKIEENPEIKLLSEQSYTVYSFFPGYRALSIIHYLMNIRNWCVHST